MEDGGMYNFSAITKVKGNYGVQMTQSKELIYFNPFQPLLGYDTDCDEEALACFKVNEDGGEKRTVLGKRNILNIGIHGILYLKLCLY